MLSLGIRFGQGFDNIVLHKLIEAGKRPYEYDVIVLGTNSGGMACVEELVKYKKKIAIVQWRIPSPAEEESQDEDLHQMSQALQLSIPDIRNRTIQIFEDANKSELAYCVIDSRFLSFKESKRQHSPLPSRQTEDQKWFRKVRKSKLDLMNAVINMGEEARKYMHEMAMMEALSNNDITLKKKNKLSWGRMMEKLLDHIIEKNWDILTNLIQDRVAIFRGWPKLLDEHTIEIIHQCGEIKKLTAEKIIAAIDVHNRFPDDIKGAREFGVDCDDFTRMSSSPGRTLIVGAGSLGLECAGILAAFNFLVVVISRSEILKNCDAEIRDMIVESLSRRGVQFITQMSLVSIQKNSTGKKLIAEFIPTNSSSKSKHHIEEFDTVLFTTKEKSNFGHSTWKAIQLESERLTGHIYSETEKLMLQSIGVITDTPENSAIVKLAGKQIGKGLFRNNEEHIKTPLIPSIIRSLLVYAYVGVSEGVASMRLGKSCINVYSGDIHGKDIVENNGSLKDETCYVKVIALKERDLVVGLHLLGTDAITLMHKILESSEGMLRESDLPNTITELKTFPENAGEWESEHSEKHTTD